MESEEHGNIGKDGQCDEILLRNVPGMCMDSTIRLRKELDKEADDRGKFLGGLPWHVLR